MRYTHSICRSFLLLTILFAGFSTHAMNEESLSHMAQELQAEKPDKLSEEVIKKVYNFFNRIICAHTDLASLIQEDAITTKDKEHKTTLIQGFIQTQKVISDMMKQFVQSPTRTQLHHTLKEFDAIVQHLKTALQTDITAFTAYEPVKKEDEELAQRSQPIESSQISQEELDARFEEIEQTFQSVQKNAEKAGLHWYNHLYRNTFDRFIVQPCDKYNIHWKAFYTTAALIGGTYLWYKLNTSKCGLPPELGGNNESSYTEDDPLFKKTLGKAHDNINYWIRRALKWTPAPAGSTKYNETINYLYRTQNPLHNPEALENLSAQEQERKIEAARAAQINLRGMEEDNIGVHPTNLFGHLEAETVNAIHGHWYLGGALLWKPFREALIEKYSTLSEKTKNKISKFHNWLKGGAFYQRYKQRKFSYRIEPRYTFDDIIGLDHAKQVLSDIIKYIDDPESYDRAGLTPAMGYLLFGPTRTGKSMIAEGLAGELQKLKGSADDFPFFVIESRYIAADGNFNAIMNLVKNYAPCIIFIDEIDMLPLHRDKNKGKNTILQEFLSTISGCMTTNNPDKQVIIIAATNRPENLDKSIRSRLSVHIPFEYPSFIHRAECLMREIEGKGLPVEQFDIRKLAEQTEKASYQELHEIINNAQFLTREQGRPITQMDIERSMNTELRNIIYHDYAHLSDNDRHTLAVHMAGHALSYLLLESDCAQLSQVTIRPVKTKIDDESIWAECFKKHDLPNIQYGQVFTHFAGDSLKFTNKQELKRLCMIELAGRVAEDILLGANHTTKDTCSQHDTTKAFYWARKYQLNGVDESLLEHSKSMQDKIASQAYEFMQVCEKEIYDLLKERKDLIEFVSEGLKQFEVLGTEEVNALIDLHKMMDGKSPEEFLNELQEQQKNEQADAHQDEPQSKTDTVEQESDSQ